MKAFCVINPIAGKGFAKNNWEKIILQLEKTGFEINYALTEAKGQATKLARDSVNNGAQLVIAVGGDGTISEVVNGIVDSDALLGIVPAGTGNDFARAVNIPLNYLEAIIAIGGLKHREIDLGFIHNQYFINIAGIGFDAQVAAQVHRGNKILKGKLAYLWTLLAVFFSYKPAKIKILTNGQLIEKEILTATIANAKFYGGGIEIAPQAKVDDGQLDLVVIENMNKAQLILSLPKLLKGEHLSHEKVSTFKSDSLYLNGDPNLSAHADGEVIPGLPLEVKVKPKAIKIVVP